MENFLLPNEIFLKILGYLGLGDIMQCAKVSKRFNTICNDKSLGYISSMLIMKDLTVDDQKFVNSYLIARPEFKEVTIHSISLEGKLETRLSRESVKWTFMGPKRYCMEKEMKVLKSQGASVCVMQGDLRTRNVMKFFSTSTFEVHTNINTLELGLYYHMPPQDPLGLLN